MGRTRRTGRRKRRTRKSRHIRRKRGLSSRRGKISPAFGRIVPQRHVVKMRYAEQIDMPAGSIAGVLASVIYASNNIFDPRVAVGGGQPHGHDQWATFYKQYLVVGSKITVIVPGIEPLQTIVGIYRDDDLVVNSTTHSELVMKGQGRYFWKYSPAADVQDRAQRLTHKFSFKSHVSDGQGSSYTADEDNWTLFGSNTAGAVSHYFHIINAPIATADQVSAGTWLMMIDYIVLMKDRKDIASS